MNSATSAPEEPALGAASGTAGAVTGLFRSFTNLAATFVSIAQTRLELLTTELQEEVHHTVGLVMWALIALVTAMIAMFFAGLTIILVYWETHPVLASLLVMSAFLLAAIIAALVLVAKVRTRPRFLDSTLSELSKDADSLKSSLRAQP